MDAAASPAAPGDAAASPQGRLARLPTRLASSGFCRFCRHSPRGQSDLPQLARDIPVCPATSENSAHNDGMEYGYVRDIDAWASAECHRPSSPLLNRHLGFRPSREFPRLAATTVPDDIGIAERH
jgi:hypothetical protein